MYSVQAKALTCRKHTKAFSLLATTFAIVVLMLFPSVAHAQVIESPPPEDVSMRFLRTLFGEAIDFMTSAFGGSSGPGTSAAGAAGTTDPASTGALFADSMSSVGGALGGMFQIFSMLCAVGASLIIFFMTIIALANTAVEGEPMGRSINTFWTPIRIATAISFVAPIPQLGGLSFLQGIILLLATVSISFANTMYKYVIDSVAGGKPLSHVAGTRIDPNLLMDSARIAACVASANAESLVGTYKFDIEREDNKLVVAGEDVLGRDVCGAIEISCDHATDASKVVVFNLFGYVVGNKVDAKAKFYQNACTAVFDGYQAAFNEFYTGVSKVLQDDSAKVGTVVQSSFANALKKYDTVYPAKFEAARQQYEQELQALRQDGGDEVLKRGWTLAGGWYMFISSETHELSRALAPKITRINFDSDALRSTSEAFSAKMALIESNLAPRIKEYLTSNKGSLGEMAIDEVFTLGDSAERMADAYYGKSVDMTGALWRQIAGDYPNDPLRSLASFGHNLIDLVGLLYAGGKIGDAVKDAPVIGAMASVITKNAVGKVASALGSVGGEAINFLIKHLIFLLVLGFMLAYYLPFVPTLYWLGGVVGWFLMIIESVIAAPLWAVAHAIPSQEDGFAGRWALQGYQLLVNVIARPVILILAFIMTVFLFQFGAYIFIGLLMSATPFVLNSTSYSALSFTIMSLVILVIGLIMVAHRTHEFIYQGADRVISWLGFGVTSLGTTQGWSEMEGRVKMGLESARAGVLAGRGMMRR